MSPRLCVPTFQLQAQNWGYGGALTSCRLPIQPRGHLQVHLFVRVQLPVSSLGMWSVCPEHLSLAKGHITFCLRLLGLSRAASATGTKMFWPKQPGNIFPTPELEVWCFCESGGKRLSRPAPSQATGLGHWGNLGSVKATAALESQAVGPQLKITLISHFFSFNCTEA